MTTGSRILAGKKSEEEVEMSNKRNIFRKI